MDASSARTSSRLGVANIQPSEGGSDEDLTKVEVMKMAVTKICTNLIILGENFKDLLYTHPNMTGDGRRSQPVKSDPDKIDHVLCVHHIPWGYCVGLGVDNTMPILKGIVEL